MAEIVKEFSEPKGIPHVFGIGDLGVEAGDYPGEPMIWNTGRPAGDDWLDTGPNGLTLEVDPQSLSYIRYELWTGPPPAEESWTHTWEGPIYLASGRIAAITMDFDEPDYHTEFTLPRVETTWQTRVQAKFPVFSEPGFPKTIGGPVFFKVQFWLE